MNNPIPEPEVEPKSEDPKQDESGMPAVFELDSVLQDMKDFETKLPPIEGESDWNLVVIPKDQSLNEVSVDVLDSMEKIMESYKKGGTHYISSTPEIKQLLLLFADAGVAQIQDAEGDLFRTSKRNVSQISLEELLLDIGLSTEPTDPDEIDDPDITND